MSLKITQKFTKTVIFAEYFVLASTVFHKNFIFADKYVILAASNVTPLKPNYSFN